MSELNKQFEVNSDLLGNAGVPLGAGHVNSFRNVPSTSSGDVATAPPPLPPRLDPMASQNFAMGQNYNYGGMGGMAGYGMGGYGGYGMGAGMGSYGMGYGGYGMGGMGMGGGMYGGYNRFGVGGPMYGGDIENRFIQLAEETSRPAFDSIQSLVNAVGSIAMMLENTFFALTSSFRAILGVAENFGRLRSLFAQFWSTFAVIRTLNWIIRKLLVILGLRTENEFKAWAEAVATTQAAPGSTPAQPRASTWPVLMFFGVVAAAPYLVFKMLSGLSNSINEKLNEPSTWQNPLRAIATYDFQATNPQELSFAANQVLTIAPQYLQNQLWNSGWLMASTDRQTAGLVPVNYIKIIKPTTEQNSNENVTEKPEDYMTDMNKMYEQEL